MHKLRRLLGLLLVLGASAVLGACGGEASPNDAVPTGPTNQRATDDVAANSVQADEGASESPSLQNPPTKLIDVDEAISVIDSVSPGATSSAAIAPVQPVAATVSQPSAQSPPATSQASEGGGGPKEAVSVGTTITLVILDPDGSLVREVTQSD